MDCHKVVRIRQWAIENNNHLTGAHNQGKQDIVVYNLGLGILTQNECSPLGIYTNPWTHFLLTQKEVCLQQK